jgi:F-type H+-transporting ATPase subunit delta
MIVASRYAKSLMELAVENKQLDAVKNDMKTIQLVCNQNREFILFLNSPVIKTDKKLAVLSDLFKGKISDLSLSFLNLITSKRREAYIGDITAAFDELYKENKNIFTAVVTSANGLDEKTRLMVIDLIKSQMNGEVELTEKIDANTIGGFILKIGDRQIDKSVARQLNNLKKELLNKELN